MSQSRSLSLAEAVTNVGLGCKVALVTRLLASPVVGIQASMAQHLWLTTIFPSVSLARSYLVRRLFNRIGTAA